MSERARAPSISAPAAADEASQARVMSPASVASRRICAALPASWTALTSSACADTSSWGGAIAEASFRIRATVRWSALSVPGAEPDSAFTASSGGLRRANRSIGVRIAAR